MGWDAHSPSLDNDNIPGLMPQDVTIEIKMAAAAILTTNFSMTRLTSSYYSFRIIIDTFTLSFKKVHRQTHGSNYVKS